MVLVLLGMSFNVSHDDFGSVLLRPGVDDSLLHKCPADGEFGARTVTTCEEDICEIARNVLLRAEAKSAECSVARMMKLLSAFGDVDEDSCFEMSTVPSALEEISETVAAATQEAVLKLETAAFGLKLGDNGSSLGDAMTITLSGDDVCMAVLLNERLGN